MINSYQSNVLEKPRGSLEEHKRWKRNSAVRRFTKESIAQIEFDSTFSITDWGNPEYEPIELTIPITPKLAA